MRIRSVRRRDWNVMRGKPESQRGMFFAIDLERRIASDHPLQPIKRMVDAEVRRMSQAFDVAYCFSGRPSVPTERIL